MDMTPQPISRDDFARLYTPGQVLVPEGIRTSLAQERSKGRLVMVHELVNSPGERRRVLNLLNQLGAEHSALVLGAFLIDDEPVYVTKFLLGFVSFRQWLEHAVSEKATVLLDTRSDVSELDRSTHDGAPTNLALKTTEVERVSLSLESVPALEETSVGLTPVPPTPPPQVRAPVPPPVLRTATIPAVANPPAPPAAPVASPPSLRVPNVAAADTPAAEDFSGIFGRAEAPAPAPLAAPVVPTPVSPATAAPQVDDFSGLFGKATPPPPSIPAEDFSGIFRKAPAPSPAPPPLTPKASPADDAGSFTEFFGGSQGTSAPPAPQVPPPVAPIATAPVRPPSPIPPVAIPTPPALPSQRDLPPTPAPIVASPPPQPAPPAPPPSQDSGGFTELFGGGAPKHVESPRPPLPPLQQDVRASAAPPPPRINMPGAAVTPPQPRPAAAVAQPPSAPQLSPLMADPVRPQAPRVPSASSAAPSDFTEMLKPARPPLPSAGPPVLPQTPPPATPAAAKPSMLPLYIVLGVCVVLVIAVLIYAATVR